MRRQHSIHCKNNCVFLLVNDAKQDIYTFCFTKGNMFLEYEIKFYLSWILHGGCSLREMSAMSNAHLTSSRGEQRREGKR